MLKFKAESHDGPLLGFGLSAENVRRLQQGEPISVNLRDMGLPGGTVLIFYGETEDAMARDLQQFIGPETIIHPQPSPHERH